MFAETVCGFSVKTITYEEDDYSDLLDKLKEEAKAVYLECNIFFEPPSLEDAFTDAVSAGRSQRPSVNGRDFDKER